MQLLENSFGRKCNCIKIHLAENAFAAKLILEIMEVKK